MCVREFLCEFVTLCVHMCGGAVCVCVCVCVRACACVCAYTSAVQTRSHCAKLLIVKKIHL